MTQLEITTSARALTDTCHQLAKEAGWWNGDRLSNPLSFSNCLMLVVSELAEAMEGDRKDLMDDHLPHRKSREVELADALIRIFDMAGGFNLDVGAAMLEKLDYNKKRADHKLANRSAAGGKKY